MSTTVTKPLTLAQAKLVADNASMARAYAYRFLRAHPRAKHISEDLIQEAYIGLCIAAQRFDEKRGWKFVTYAFWWMGATVREAFRTDANPATARANGSKSVWVARGEMPIQDAGHTPAPDEGLDAHRLFALAYDALKDDIGSRNADLFLRTEFADFNKNAKGHTAKVSSEMGISRERGRQIRHRAREKFYDWAARMRMEGESRVTGCPL